MEIITKSSQETYSLGQKIGSSLKGGEIFALKGELGSGKTTFIQGLAESIEVKSRIVSPTFLLMKTYPGKLTLHHLDLYRLEHEVNQEFKALGIMDVWESPENVTVIEWADKANVDLFPLTTSWVSFEVIDENQRKITFQK